MKKYIVITGGSSGIGQACAVRFAKLGYNVWIIGRDKQKLKATANLHDNIESFSADIRFPECQRSIVNMFNHGDTIEFLIHSSTSIDPIGSLKNITPEQWQLVQETNIEGPLFLTKQLLPLLKKGRVLFMSTRLAHQAAPGLGAHCVTKAAMHMAYQVLATELQSEEIYVGSVHPGVVDTPLQAYLRSQSPASLPIQPILQNLKDQDLLLKAEDAASFVEWLLTKTDNKKFIEAEWNIYDSSHHHHWMRNPISKEALSIES